MDGNCTADGVTIWSDEVGPEGAPLIALVHGSMDRSAGFLRVSRRLDDRFRVLRYDRRGYGRSALPAGGGTPVGVESHVGDLVCLLGGRRAVLVGHSFGGNVVLACAARHPELVASVAVYEAPLSWEPWWPSGSAGGRAVADGGDPADAAEGFMRRLIGDERWERLPARTRLARRAEGPAMVAELRDLRARPPWRAEQIECPVVVGHGSRAADHHRRAMREVHDRVGGSDLVELDGCGHDAPNAHPELFVERLVGGAARAAGEPWADAFSR